MTRQREPRPTDHHWDRRRSCRLQRLEEPLDMDKILSAINWHISFFYFFTRFSEESRVPKLNNILVLHLGIIWGHEFFDPAWF
jgi:hypothetical protein